MGDRAGRLKCDELLGRYLDMWKPDVEVNVIDELSERLRKARLQVERSVELEPKLLPEAVELEPVATVEVVTPPTSTEVEPSPEEYDDWVARLG